MLMGMPMLIRCPRPARSVRVRVCMVVVRVRMVVGWRCLRLEKRVREAVLELAVGLGIGHSGVLSASWSYEERRSE